MNRNVGSPIDCHQAIQALIIIAVMSSACASMRADTFHANFKGPGLDPGLSLGVYVQNGGGDYSVKVANGFATLSQPKKVGGSSAGYIQTDFTVGGNFFATVTEDNTGLASGCNICGNQEFSDFIASFPDGSNLAEEYVDSDENGDFFGWGFNGHNDVYNLGGSYIQWAIGRQGDVVSLYYGSNGVFGPPVAQSVQPIEDIQFLLVLGNLNNNDGAGSVVFSDFTITADKINGSPTPEPGTWLLSISGLAGIGLWRRRCFAHD